MPTPRSRRLLALSPGRLIAATLAVGMPAIQAGCGEEQLATTTLQTTSNETGSDDQDGETALIVLGAVLLVSTAAGLVVYSVSEESAYLELHQQDVRRALARGDGAFVRDLGQALALPPELLPRLQHTLKTSRAALDATLVGAKVDAARTQRFGRELTGVLKADPELAPYVKGLVTRYGPMLARR